LNNSHIVSTGGDPPLGHTLTSRIAAGDESAFTEFYELWFASTLALSRAVSRRDEAWCLDVVQDVMMIVVKKMPSLKTEAALRAWMARTVMHAVTDRTRSEVRRRRREEAAVEAAAAVSREPWSDLCDQEMSAWLAASIAELPDADQALLQASFGASSTVAAEAVLLGISSDAAHGRLRRALGKLRQKAEELWNGA
jgi:RNA polymerase sigma factor (sigma-70 family)